MTATRNSMRLKFKHSRNGGVNDLYLYDIALACSLGFVTGSDGFIEEMREYFKHKGEDTIDHADNVIFNNTVHNLSIMTDLENKRKGSIAGRFTPPDYLFTAVHNGVYLIQYIRLFDLKNKYSEKAKALRSEKKYVCMSEKCYVDKLKEIYYEGQYDMFIDVVTRLIDVFGGTVGEKVKISPNEWRKYTGNKTNSLRELENAIVVQKNLIQDYIANPNKWIICE